MTSDPRGSVTTASDVHDDRAHDDRAGDRDVPTLVPAGPIVTSRFLLRPMTVSDIAPVVAYRSRPGVHAHLSHGALSREALEAKFHHRLARMSMTSDSATEVQLVVERRGAHEAPAVIGDCGFRISRAWTKDDAPTEHLVARIHYAFDDTTAGQGYGTETVTALVDFLFGRPGVHRIQADVFADNTASRKVLEKVGFRCEGYFVDDGIIDGRFVDATIYSLLRREWESRRA